MEEKIVGAWEFPEIELQAEAVLRKEIAELTLRVQELEAENLELTRATAGADSIFRQIARSSEEAQTKMLQQYIENIVSMRTIHLQERVIRAEIKLRNLRRLPAVWRTLRRAA